MPKDNFQLEIEVSKIKQIAFIFLLSTQMKVLVVVKINMIIKNVFPIEKMIKRRIQGSNGKILE